jgi:Peptidase family C25
MKVIPAIGCCLLTATLFPAQAQKSPSTLRDGTWAKFSIEKNGVYKIDYTTLKQAGLNPDAINPRDLQLYAYPTGMLPQTNSAFRPVGLVELDITVSGEEDGKFNSGDFILFYGQGPDRVEYNEAKGIFEYQNNLYADKNYYFLTVGVQNGQRIATVEQATGDGFVNEFLDYGYYETDSYNELKSGREWFGESFETRADLTVRFSMAGVAENSEIKMVSSVMAQTYSEASFRLLWNNVQLLDRKMQVVPETQYGAKGRMGVDTLVFSAATVNAGSNANQDIKYQYTKGASGRSAGYLNYFLFQVTRKSGWYGNPTLFTIPAGSQNNSRVDFSSPPSGLSIWDVTDPFRCEKQSLSITASAQFMAATGTARNYAAFTSADVPSAKFEQKVENQSIVSAPTPNLLIVTHSDFISEALALADHRERHYGIDVVTVTTDEIYNEFSGGRQDVSAIRDFVKFLYDQSPDKLKNLLLFGRGSYDYKKRVFNNTNFVPTYESRNSLSPLETYSSDDFFGFLENGEGEWNESPAKNHTLDIGVGRLPVRTAAEARDVVDKLIAYDTDPERYAGWRQEILFVADDGDFNIHQGQADELAESIETYGGFSTDKIYVDAFEQEDRASGQISPKAAEALNRKVNKGFAIVNFTGHGSEQQWMQERILDTGTPSLLTNNPKLPLFVTATCEFGRHDDPLLISTAELLLKRKKGGAIALVTTTRPVNSGTNFSLNKMFYSSFFDTSVGKVKDLGTLFKETKNGSQSGVANRNFSLLGDPSLRFGPPVEKVVVTKIQTVSGSDTIKALSKVRVEGEIQLNGKLNANFDGTIEATLLDKRTLEKTLGDENPAFNYYMWSHALFRGQATIDDGQFIFEMMLPANLAADVGEGKMVLYAFTSDKSREALGTFTGFKIGKMEEDFEADSKGPSITLFMGDTTFINGGYTNSDTRLVGRLSDKNGINISGYDPTQLVAVLDDEKSFLVNDYYVADKDDFTSGTFSYPLFDLNPGRHTIRFTAWDNYNNESSAAIDFEVGQENELLIEDLVNFPNPFSEATTVQFTHSRSGEDLEAQVLIYDAMGQLASSREFSIANSTYKVNLFDWDGLNNAGTKMSTGLYIMKLSVRSLSDGAKKDKIAKLILVN